MEVRLNVLVALITQLLVLAATSTSSKTPFEWRDNSKPVFRDCKDYRPSVKEEQPTNTFVIRVKADDPDERDTITYKFVSVPTERPKFRIDPKTGVISTAHSFDRDEPIHEKEVYVTVQASDDGRPRLDDVCTFKVTIEDINDNPPVFDKSKYDESMSEDTQVNNFIMRISASDLDDGDNSIVKYELLPERDFDYFRIDEQHGLIYLKRPIDKQPGQQYVINVHAYNTVPDYPQDAQIEVRIRVIESDKKPPTFINPQIDIILLKEDFRDFSAPIVTLRAQSNVPDKPEVIFELITGRTEQTNSKKTFVFNQIGDQAVISLGKSLDYEAITDYTLTMSVRNTYDLVAEHVIKIKVEDVNDNIPYFTEVKTGTILENEPTGTPVMQVRAFDMDGTEANNIIRFELADNTEYFAIDPQTGNITSLSPFDREERDFYNVKVIATDNSPSSLYNTGEHNRGNQVFRIQIADKNDHKPHFQQDEYIADKLPENSNINSVVIEVNAIDEDNEAQIAYTIEDGNVGDAFKIEALTGKITVNKPLDYETITEYTLNIKANDGLYEDHATVTIRIEDINDNPPVFKNNNYSTTIQEESIIDDCILVIEAYDPDIKDRDADQKITYSVVRTELQSYLEIDNKGCLRLKKPLDRDEPHGHKNWQVLIAANDESGDGLRSVTDVTIILTDINDNAPFLVTKMPVIWYENQDPGPITQLEASDYDEPQNGAPFSYAIDFNANDDIKLKFAIIDGDTLYARVTFDREEQKEYYIPINITDNGVPQMSRVNLLYLIIGDVNDNAMREGSSKIFVYNYKGEVPDTTIGRIYVDDKDDWDLDDKDFGWDEGSPHDQFKLNTSTGMITMLEGTQPGDYVLKFIVTEQSNLIPKHSVPADVIVTVKDIPEEAVDKSGSIRFVNVTDEDFIKLPRYAELETLNMKDRFQHMLAKLFNTSVENVDVFTVLSNNKSLDVRFSAHGSPYYEPEKLNGMVAQNQQDLERQLGVQMLMINIDECLIEKNKCESSCTNILQKSNVPLLVYTNTTSFVGVNAYTQAECICVPRKRDYCLNGGTFVEDYCECIDGFTGPYCELVAIGFYGNGYAMYPPISPCDNTKIALELSPQTDNGLVMYIGPMNYNSLLPLSDFLSLELVNGFPVLTVDYGTGAIKIEHKHIRLLSGKTYAIDIVLQKASVEMTVDNCKLSTCMSLGAPQGPNEFLNVNSPLQLGGTPVNLEMLGSQLNWSHIPQSVGYSGCIRNLTIDGFTYDLGRPAISKYADPGCQSAVAVAVSFNIGKNFIIPILICLICLIILILAFVVHKRQQNGWLEKDTDDIRENIINYEDEGGGERDTDYDLNVLRAPPLYEDKPYKTNNLLMKEPNDVPDIGGFLGDKKDSCDKDSGAHPIDDVRHYAYEGDGNSTGSLSSLASCTDDGDLNFDYLSNFGPRFRKLADMYGEEPSDTDSNVDDDQGWRI